MYVVAQAPCAFAGPFLLPFAVLVRELCRLWLKCVCKEKSRTSSNGVLSHLRSESVPVHVYRYFEFLPVTVANINSLYSLQDSQSHANVTGYLFTKDTGKATDVYETRTEC